MPWRHCRRGVRGLFRRPPCRVRRVCPGYVEKGGGTLVVSPPCEVWVRRRATLPHPSGCSTIAVPGLSFRVRNGSGRLPWAMAAANLQLSSHGFPWGIVWWVGDRIVDATEGLIHVTCRVSPCRPSDACSCHPLTGRVCSVAVRLLVPVGSTPRGASTSGLSTTCSPWSLQTPVGVTES